MRHVVLLACVVTIAAPCVSVGGVVQWSGNGHWYLAVYDSAGISWQDAKDAAEIKGGYLATMDSAEENDFVFSLVSDEKFWFLGASGSEYSFGPWLGGYQTDDEAGFDQHWHWVTEEPWIYANWSRYNPNNAGGHENWLHYFTNTQPGTLTPGSTWNDAPATNRERGFIIEWPADASAGVPAPASTTWGAIKAVYPR